MELSWTSLLPSLLAIVFAIVTRKVLLALIGGIILANVLLFWPAPANIAYGTLDSTWESPLTYCLIRLYNMRHHIICGTYYMSTY